jgi:hypothetical protein
MEVSDIEAGNLSLALGTFSQDDGVRCRMWVKRDGEQARYDVSTMRKPQNNQVPLDSWAKGYAVS